MVVVDLGALAPSLMEAELFGHEEGAFTGAHRARLGRVRRADGGTLLLDGIEDLAPEAQVKLLRVLQERVVEPLGSSEPVPVDVRIVATAGPGLDEALDEGRFREDLYFRLAVVVVQAPALRARLEDLPGLCDAILKQISVRTGVAVRALGPDSMERLLAHPWPGNVRELENALERVLVLGVESTGPVAADEFHFLEEGLADVDLLLARQILAHGIALDVMDHTLMEEALAQARGNHSAAARVLGLSRKAFNYRLRKLREARPSDGTPDGEA
jgi:DNA-binding NtrC family response regulator